MYKQASNLKNTEHIEPKVPLTIRPIGIIRPLTNYPIGIIRDLIAYSANKGLNCFISLYELLIRS